MRSINQPESVSKGLLAVSRRTQNYITKVIHKKLALE